MASSSKKTSRKAGRPPKPKAQRLAFNVSVKFMDEQAEIIDRAVRKQFDNRSNWARRKLLEAAHKELDLEPPSSPAEK